MCIEKELRDSTNDMYDDSFSGIGMCSDPKVRNASGPYASFALFARRLAVRHVVAARHRIRSQVPITIDDIDSLVTLRHWDTETAVVASAFLDDVTAKFPNHLNQALGFPRKPIDLKLEKLEGRRQDKCATVNQ